MIETKYQQKKPHRLQFEPNLAGKKKTSTLPVPCTFLNTI